MATGYTGGDPNKLDKAGDAMSGPLTLAGPPTQPSHAATKAYVDASSGGGDGGRLLVVRRGYVTSGHVTPQASPANWSPLTGGPVMAIPAAVGDYVELDLGLLYQPGTSFLDVAVMVGGALVRFSSTGGPAAAVEGDPALYAQPSVYRTSAGVFGFEVTAGDLDGDQVVMVFATKGDGTGRLFAGDDYPLRWRAINYGQVSLS